MSEKKKKIIIDAAGTYQRELPGDIEYIAVLPPSRTGADRELHFQWYTTDDVILHEGNYRIDKNESIILTKMNLSSFLPAADRLHPSPGKTGTTISQMIL